MTNEEAKAYFEKCNEGIIAASKDENVYDYEKKEIMNVFMKRTYEANVWAVKALSALSTEGELTNEKAIAFLQDNGWLVEHDRIMTSGSAEGEYIKKEDALAELNKWDWQELYLPIHFKENILDVLPTYSFPEREKGELEKIEDEIWNLKEKCTASDYLGCGILDIIERYKKGGKEC